LKIVVIIIEAVEVKHFCGLVTCQGTKLCIK
jgi:hypothetical protein